MIGASGRGSRLSNDLPVDWHVEPHPKLIVLDLDQTLWPFDAAHPRYALPHHPASHGGIQCRESIATPFAEAISVVKSILAVPNTGTSNSSSWRIAVASANSNKDVCTSLLRHLGLMQPSPRELVTRRRCVPEDVDPFGDVFGGIEQHLLEIHPGSKTVHLQRLEAASGIAFCDMLFFDDRRNNISVAQRLGVVAYQVSPLTGLTRNAFAEGMRLWRTQRQSGKAMATWLSTGKKRVAPFPLNKADSNKDIVDNGSTAAVSDIAPIDAVGDGIDVKIMPNDSRLDFRDYEGQCRVVIDVFDSDDGV